MERPAFCRAGIHELLKCMKVFRVYIFKNYMWCVTIQTFFFLTRVCRVTFIYILNEQLEKNLFLYTGFLFRYVLSDVAAHSSYYYSILLCGCNNSYLQVLDVYV